MADLTGQTPAATYKGLLQVNDYTDGIANNTGSNALVIQDGAGNATALAVSTDNVGIGTTSPLYPLQVDGPNNTTFDNVSNVLLNGEDAYNSSNAGAGIIFGGKFNTAGDNTAFAQIAGIKENTTDSDSNGALVLGTRTGSTLIMEKMRIDSAGDVTPGTDNAQDIGSGAKRWDDIYATNTTIQTSDRELKQDIEELSEAEARVAQACKSLLRKYRWKNSVAEKGDDARIHFGIMAQDLEAAFAAEGLDAGRYGMFIKNTWWEADRVVPAVEAVEAQPERTEIDIFNNIEDAPEGATEVTQRGVRYAELLAFIIAAI
jgi:hypothetical protein